MLFCTLCFSTLCIAQKINSDYLLHIHKTSTPIIVDGLIEESAWKEADVAKNFHMIVPLDNRPATQHSEARMTFDDKYFYFAVIFYNNKTKGPYNVESFRRDFSFVKNDNLLIAIDPFNNLTTGFSFGLNAFGAQWDGTMFNGGKVDLSWDTKWFSEVVFDEEKWVCEIAIPFSSIRYKKGQTQWGINFGRLDLKASEKSSWAPVPRQFPSVSLAYTGSIIWDSPPPSQTKNFSLIPYTYTRINKNHLMEYSSDFNVGGDIKLGLSSSLNLDITINPDFSQVDVDQEVTNLDRFELFYPEKRQFFLENADLFANFGYDNIRPFFSRRIGLGVPIDGGVRLSGNINENLRLGVMDIQTQSLDNDGIPKENFSVLSLQQKIMARSNIGLILINKQGLNISKDKHPNINRYNRTLGIEYNYASSNNLWNAKTFYIKSFNPNHNSNASTIASHLEYKSTHWYSKIQQEFVGKGFNAEVGYIPRKDYFKISGLLGYLFYLKKEVKLISHGPSYYQEQYFNALENNTDILGKFNYEFNFNNRSKFKFIFNHLFVKLLNDFDPTQEKISYLEALSEHKWNTVGIEYSSKPQSLFTFNFQANKGGFYNEGTSHEVFTEIGYRIQPYLSLNGIINYTHIYLGDPWNVRNYWLIGSKTDITFNRSLFFTNTFQYNQQNKLLSFNSRFQWRYKPTSDLFIVFNSQDEYFIDKKSWSLTFKISYWLSK